MTLGSTASKAFGSEHGCIAGVVAVGLALMLGMAPRGQRLSTFLTLQARPVPVLPQGGHPLSKVYLLVALGALGHGGAGPGRVAGRERQFVIAKNT